MKPIVLIAAAPLALTACNFGLPSAGGNVSNVSTANAAASDAVPDSIEVNGVTYVRAGLDKIPPASATPTPAASATSFPPPISETDSSPPPPSTGSGDAARAHGD